VPKDFNIPSCRPMSKVKVSIVLRTLNEEMWLKSCVNAIKAQNYSDYELILVDSGSTDLTVELAKTLEFKKILSISDFTPGKAINLGVEHADGDYIVVLSAHCVPENELWLSELVSAMDEPSVAGAYGRQLPLHFTPPDDVRDLLMTFGIEDRLQTADPMFHNANSIIRKAVWENFPFDPEISNIEDRAWAQLVLLAGHQIRYVSAARVYHYHGLHQHGSKESFRASPISKIIKGIDNSHKYEEPEFLKCENFSVPVLVTITQNTPVEKIPELIDQIRTISDQSIYLLSAEEFSLNKDCSWLIRDVSTSIELDLGTMLKNALLRIELLEGIVDGLVFIDPNYEIFRVELLESCLNSLFRFNYSTVFPAYVDTGSYWKENQDGSFSEITSSLDLRENIPKVYRACYGQGTVFRAPVLRLGDPLARDIGIIPFYEQKLVTRLSNSS